MSAEDLTLKQKQTARHFLALVFQEGFTPPIEVYPEEDGDVCLEWYKHPRHIVSVSLTPDNTLCFAALFGTASTKGTSQYTNGVPAALAETLRLFEKADIPTDHREFITVDATFSIGGYRIPPMSIIEDDDVEEEIWIENPIRPKRSIVTAKVIRGDRKPQPYVP